MVPGSFPRPALDKALRGHPRRLRYRQPHHQPCAGRHSRIYNCQSSSDKGAQKVCILVPTILVCSSSGVDDMRRRRFADAEIEEWGNNDASVQDISRVDERFGS